MAEEESLENLLALGRMGLELGYFEQAQAYFDRALALDPDNPEALLGKARACQDVELALSLVERALEVDPENASARALREALEAQRPPTPPPPAEGEIEQPYILPLEPEAPTPVTIYRGEAPPSLASLLGRRTLLIALAVVMGLLLVGGLSVLIVRLSKPAEGPALGTPAPGTPALAPTEPANPLQQAQAACVLVIVPQSAKNTFRRGSGSVISKDGLVLTNYHVLLDDNQVLLNPQGLAFVGFSEDVRYPPSRWYIAVLINGDFVRDLAILRIVATSSGRPVRGTSFPAMVLDEQDGLTLGQTLIGLGYPALGGKTLTLTKGTMAGFEMEGKIRLGKTDSELLPGASGGAVLDETGRLVGIIRMVYTDYRTQGRLSYFILLSEARALIREAQAADSPRLDLRWMVELASQLGF